jgi:hypothetical protein
VINCMSNCSTRVTETCNRSITRDQAQTAAHLLAERVLPRQLLTLLFE